MTASDLVNLSGLMDDAKCFAFVRQRRWPEGIRCPACDDDAVIRDGHDDTQPCRQRYRLQGVFRAFRRPDRHRAGRTPPASARVGSVPLLHGVEPLEPADCPGAGPGCIGYAGYDGATAPRAGCQGASGGTARRGGDRRSLCRGRPQRAAEESGQKGRLGRCRKLAGAPGRGTLEKDKPPVLGLIQRGGQVVLRLLANVQQTTIRPIITAAVAPGTLVHTDEYAIYARLPAWGYGHKTVCHGAGEYARDETGTASAKFMSTQSKDSGLCCVPGCARTGASRKTSCRSTSASSSSCTTRADAAKPCSAPSSPAWSRDKPSTTPEPNKSLMHVCET